MYTVLSINGNSVLMY